MTLRSGMWLGLALLTLLGLAGTIVLWGQWQQIPPEPGQNIQAQDATKQAAHRLRLRVRNTCSLMARGNGTCETLSKAEFDRRWLAIPASRRSSGRIDSLSRLICENPAGP
ncbi:MAG: hypothetical protein JRF33_06475 [Deltaproteobacteria bacterium]|nr:hypothetical protein [Deltaproteobacteria bacterium]